MKVVPSRRCTRNSPDQPSPRCSCPKFARADSISSGAARTSTMLRPCTSSSCPAVERLGKTVPEDDVAGQVDSQNGLLHRIQQLRLKTKGLFGGQRHWLRLHRTAHLSRVHDSTTRTAPKMTSPSYIIAPVSPAVEITWAFWAGVVQMLTADVIIGSRANQPHADSQRWPNMV